ncbi:hypothetical protein [Myxococcus fulvus]|uniref:hypothetical protein n=1 Tax=Myxococcus fulvus TaxID=33 RepID=UPI0020C15CD4|nr:hypothetical protein [Myxococcus fulvus]MCK8502805.1 hypothetical protein [Myxococcus fulvus]
MKITLGVHTEREALAELALFERDPAGYRTRKELARERATRPRGLRLDATNVEAFLTNARLRAERGEISKGHVRHALEPYLFAWSSVLGSRELRSLSLADLSTALDGWATARPKRIVVLKAFTSWARDSGRLAAKDDPTLSLKVPPPRLRSMGERAFSVGQVQAAYAALTDYEFAPGYGDNAPPKARRVRVSLQSVRDVFVLRALHGMHGSEIARLARGEGTIRELPDQGEIAGTLSFPHKRRTEHVVSVGAQALAAAKRLQAKGRVPEPVTTANNIRRIVAENPALTGFKLERLRHTFITLGATGRVVTARGGGVPLELLSQIANHTSTATTKRHYLGTHIPPMVVLSVTLTNADDPHPGGRYQSIE